MTQEFSAIIECDECGSSTEYLLSGFSNAREELIMLAERSGWECDGEDLCANCVTSREWDEEEV